MQSQRTGRTQGGNSETGQLSPNLYRELDVRAFDNITFELPGKKFSF